MNIRLEGITQMMLSQELNISNEMVISNIYNYYGQIYKKGGMILDLLHVDVSLSKLKIVGVGRARD